MWHKGEDMRNKSRKNLIIILTLIASLCLTSFFSAFAVTQEEKEAAEKAAKEAAAQAEAKKKEVKETAKKRAAAIANFEEAEKELDNIQAEMETTKADIEATKASIDVTEAEIVETQKKIQKKEAEIEEQNKALGNRLTAMYKTGSAGFIDVMLNSESVEGLLANWGMVHKILESDQELLKKLQDDYKELEEIKAELLDKQAYLESQQVALEEQQLRLEGQQAETEELKNKYKAEADRLHAMEEQMAAEAAAMAAEAAAKQAEAERMIVESGGTVEVKPGQYQWPIASNWIQTSNYGWRICPFHGREFHNGLDLVLSSGTYGAPVYAVADGVITRASWYGGYGMCITYAIGGGYSVLCGHLSGYNCSTNQVVKKGQVIGYIGSTGNSTGPHLHFTVFKNGDSVNPYSLY